MTGDILDSRRRAAEEAFFAKQNEALIAKLRTAEPGPAGPASLEAASGLHDAAVLDSLMTLEVGTEGAAALSLIPLVAVAWADGELDWNEREALLQAADQAGILRGTSAYKLFEGWLADQPAPALLERWRTYVDALKGRMRPDVLERLRSEIVERSRTVAEAAGGFLGFGRVSAEEEAVLRDIETTLAA